MVFVEPIRLWEMLHYFLIIALRQAGTGWIVPTFQTKKLVPREVG